MGYGKYLEGNYDNSDKERQEELDKSQAERIYRTAESLKKIKQRI